MTAYDETKHRRNHLGQYAPKHTQGRSAGILLVPLDIETAQTLAPSHPAIAEALHDHQQAIEQHRQLHRRTQAKANTSPTISPTAWETAPFYLDDTTIIVTQDHEYWALQRDPDAPNPRKDRDNLTTMTATNARYPTPDPHGPYTPTDPDGWAAEYGLDPYANPNLSALHLARAAKAHGDFLLPYTITDNGRTLYEPAGALTPIDQIDGIMHIDKTTLENEYPHLTEAQRHQQAQTIAEAELATWQAWANSDTYALTRTTPDGTPDPNTTITLYGEGDVDAELPRLRPVAAITHADPALTPAEQYDNHQG